MAGKKVIIKFAEHRENSQTMATKTSSSIKIDSIDGSHREIFGINTPIISSISKTTEKSQRQRLGGSTGSKKKSTNTSTVRQRKNDANTTPTDSIAKASMAPALSPISPADSKSARSAAKPIRNTTTSSAQKTPNAKTTASATKASAPICDMSSAENCAIAAQNPSRQTYPHPSSSTIKKTTLAAIASALPTQKRLSASENATKSVAKSPKTSSNPSSEKTFS